MAFDLAETASKAFSQYGSVAAQAALGLTSNISPNEEPQHAYRWEFTVTGIGGSENVKFYAQTVDIPTKSQEPITKEFCGAKFHYQGKDNSSDEVTVRFYDNQSLDIYRFFFMWYSLMNSTDEAAASVNPINYMKGCNITLLDTTERIVTEDIFFSDAFPMSIGDVSLDYSSSEVMTFDVTLKFRKMTVGYGLIDAAGDVSSAVSGVRSLF